MSLLQHLGITVQYNLNDLMVGELIARGTYREVYAFGMHPQEWVVKIENSNARAFCNAAEWEFWCHTETYPEVRRWLAPCSKISMDGNVLVQARTQPLKKLPDELPDFLTDIKRENFGIYRGRVVAHDYGNLHRCFDKALKRVVMKKVSDRDKTR